MDVFSSAALTSPLVVIGTDVVFNGPKSHLVRVLLNFHAALLMYLCVCD